MKTLDGKTLAELAKPFTAAAIKFKPQTVTRDLSKGLASFYIDARLVAERLNEVVGPENWSDEYRLLADGVSMPALYYPVECRLTVCGVTKTDVGQGANTVLDDKAWKSAYSDALKRAAVKFRIGAYLYTLPNLWAPVKVGQNGKAQGFSPEGMEQLRGQYERWLKSPGNTYGAPLDHGDVAHTDSEEPKPAPRAQPRVADRGARSEDAAPQPPQAGPKEAELRALMNDWLELKPEFDRDAAVATIDKHRGEHPLPNHVEWLDRQIATFTKNIEAKKAESPFQAPKPKEKAA